MHIPAQCKRLDGGLDKLKEASGQLAELNKKLAEQKVVLAEKTSACEILLQEICSNTAVGKDKILTLFSYRSLIEIHTGIFIYYLFIVIS